MRTARPKPKNLTQVNVPLNLREFLRKVATLIEGRDESAMVLSDDLLQGDRTYGGLIDDRAGEYGFTYFPGEGVRTKWELQLTADQIRAIAHGRVRRLELWACTDDGCGSMFPSANELCFYCDYVDEGVPTLPGGEFNTRRDWALAYFALHPDCHPLQMIGAFNGEVELARRLGRFSLDEARGILSEFK
jgi:hypothetical protein